jgi:hypothetical protein
MLKFSNGRRNNVFSYVPEAFLSAEKPLTFKFKLLSNLQLARFTDQATKLDIHTGKIVLGTSEAEYQIAKLCITGWENLIVEDEEIPFVPSNDGKFKDSVIEDIDGLFDIITEVGRYISVISKHPELA